MAFTAVLPLFEFRIYRYSLLTALPINNEDGPSSAVAEKILVRRLILHVKMQQFKSGNYSRKINRFYYIFVHFCYSKRHYFLTIECMEFFIDVLSE